MNDFITQFPAEVQPAPGPRPFRRPNLLHAAVFIAITAIILLLVMVLAESLAIGVLQLIGVHHTTLAEIPKQPVMMIVSQAVAYLVVLCVAWPLFSEWWQTSFGKGIEWNWRGMRGYKWLWLSIGLMMGLIADVASTGMKVPGHMPVEQFYQNAGGIWMIAIFGITLGPLFEEITFRGFLYPALATAWESIAARFRGRDALPPADPGRAAMIFSIVLTSIAFASIHAPQISSSLSVLVLLFTVAVVLNVVRIAARSVAASTLVHAGYNLWNFLLMFFVTDGFRHLDKLQ